MKRMKSTQNYIAYPTQANKKYVKTLRAWKAKRNFVYVDACMVCLLSLIYIYVCVHVHNHASFWKFYSENRLLCSQQG